jgi:fructose-bisphosphate aldolase class II
MSLATLPELLGAARSGAYAIGYFESWDLYTLEATVEAAEVERSPVIIGVGALSANHVWLERTGTKVYGAAAELLARQAHVPISVLFNEAESLGEARAALGCGYNAVMMHTHEWTWERLITDTTALVQAAHRLGIAVEGEVGTLPEMKDGVLDASSADATSVHQAIDFVEHTGVDCLSVAVGSVHFVTHSQAVKVDTERIQAISSAVSVPLVLHGGSGTPPDQLRAAIAAGIAKVNVGTRLKQTYGAALRKALPVEDWDPNRLYGSRLPEDVLQRAAADVAVEVRRLMQVFGSSGRA